MKSTPLKSISKITLALIYSLPLSLTLASPTQASEYDEVSEVMMSYDVGCDQSRGCYQVIENKDNVSKTANLGYVIGQDDDGKSIETYSESYIDGQLVSKQETDYSLSQRLLENRTYTGNDQHLLAVKDYEYDVYDRKAQEVVNNYDNGGKVYQTNYLTHRYDDFNLDKEIQSELTSNEPGHYKSYATSYDVLGRAISRAYELDGRQYTTSSQYDGADRGVLGSDFNANMNASVYDDNGHLAQMVSYKDGVTTTGNLQASNDVEVINYEYDNYSRLVEHSLNGNTLGYDFDAIGLETGFSITNTVNSNGNLKASNNSENITYDEYNRVKSYNDYNNITYTVHYKPDSEVDYIEMQSSSSNLSGTLSSDKYEYDASVPYWLKGRVHSQTIDVNQNGHKQLNLVTKEYYAPNEVTYSLNIGKSKSVRYQVSQDGRSVQDLTIAYHYDDQGRVISETYTNQSNPTQTEKDHSENNLNKTVNYTYDPLDRLTRSETTFTSANKQTGDLAQQTEAYTYNINGDITEHVTTKTNYDGSQTIITNNYTYNDINQLLQRTELTNNNGQTTQIEYDYIYDENGNTIAVDEIKDKQNIRIYEYEYNNLNQMVGFKDLQNNQSYVYTYYPDGKRSAKTTVANGIQENIDFLYGHSGNILNEEYSQNSQLQKRSSYFSGLRFIDDLINKNDSILQFPLADRHNHPSTITFKQGQSEIQSYHLTDYGKLEQSNTQDDSTTQTNTQKDIDFELNPKIYGSGYYDPESNLQYMGARYYSADTHRFMAQDSYNLLNRYNYANANPVMNYDPDGHKSVGSWIKGAAKSAWKAMNTREFNYAANSADIAFGVLSIIGLAYAPTSGGLSLLAFAGESMGIMGGMLGLSAQIAKDAGLNNEKLNDASTALGIGSLGINAISGITGSFAAVKGQKKLLEKGKIRNFLDSENLKHKPLYFKAINPINHLPGNVFSSKIRLSENTKEGKISGDFLSWISINKTHLNTFEKYIYEEKISQALKIPENSITNIEIKNLGESANSSNTILYGQKITTISFEYNTNIVKPDINKPGGSSINHIIGAKES